MKQPFMIEINFVKIKSSFYWAFSETTRERKCTLKTKVVAKKIILEDCRSWDARRSLRERNENFKFGGIIGYGDS